MIPTALIYDAQLVNENARSGQRMARLARGRAASGETAPGLRREQGR